MPDSPAAATPALSPTVTAPEDRVRIQQKLAYGLGTFHDMWGHWLYPSLANTIFNIFLGVSPALVGAALMLNRLFDAVSDPVFGWLSDNTRSRWGRRRPYLLIGGILAGIGLPFLFAVRAGWGSTHLHLWGWSYDVSNYFWFMLASSAIYIPLMSSFNMPFQSLGAEMTPDYKERTSVFTYKNAVQKIPELGLFFASMFVTKSVWVGASGHNLPHRIRLLLTTTAAWGKAGATDKPNMLLGAQVYLVILGGFMVVGAIILFLTVRERYYGNVVARNQESIRLSETIWECLKCGPFRLLTYMSLAFNLGLSMVGTLGFYDTIYYVCHGDVASGASWNFWMGVGGMVLGFLGLPVYSFVSNRIGKRLGMMAVLSSAVLVFIASWWLYDPLRPWLQPFASGFIAFTGAGFWMLYGSCGADVMDYDELQTGKRREGAFSACGSWINKFGMVLGIGASGVILSSTGFDAKLGSAQTAHAIFMIRFMFAALPIVGLVIAILCFIRFPLSSQRMAEIRTQLEARRGKI
jgi:glycoside/pentoside/hexuronide:cation symporter, GPH family